MRLDAEKIAQLRDDLTRRLEIKADMLAMGERIAFGSDSAIMRQASEAVHALATEVLESRAEIARMRNALSIWEDWHLDRGLAALRALNGDKA
jgi:hypothetical protein